MQWVCNECAVCVRAVSVQSVFNVCVHCECNECATSVQRVSHECAVCDVCAV